MARVNMQELSGITSKSLSTFHKPLVVVVDMVNGFVYEGALHDEGIAEIIAPIKALLNEDVGRVFFADCHKEDAAEFLSYPIHCVKGTSESEIVTALKPYANHVIEKNSTNGFVSEGWMKFMEEHLHEYEDIIITGCCSDICVLQFALCLKTYLHDRDIKNHGIFVPVNMVDTYHIEGIHDVKSCNGFALNNMKMNGIEVISAVEMG